MLGMHKKNQVERSCVACNVNLDDKIMRSMQKEEPGEKIMPSMQC